MPKQAVSEFHDSPSPPQQNIHISIPRTASNLLTHLLGLPDQPSILAHPRDGYFFLPALSHRFQNNTFTQPHSTWSDSTKQEMATVLQSSASAWESWVTSATAQGRGTYVKEHVNWTIEPSLESAFLHPSASTPPATTRLRDGKPLNPTAIPDAIWSRVSATFLIRHPALTFSSALRTALDNEGIAAVLSPQSETVMRWECTFHWHVLLYKFLAAQRAHLHAPHGSQQGSELHDTRASQLLIIDAAQLADLDFVRRYARKVGLDADKTRSEWVATSADEQSRLGRTERRMKDTLLGSTGIVAGKLDSAGIDVAGERKKWEEEFGDVLAKRLEKLVGDAIEEYEWLFERSWRG